VDGPDQKAGASADETDVTYNNVIATIEKVGATANNEL